MGNYACKNNSNLVCHVVHAPQRVAEAEHAVKVQDERSRDVVGGGVSGGDVQAEGPLDVAQVGISHCGWGFSLGERLNGMIFSLNRAF